MCACVCVCVCVWGGGGGGIDEVMCDGVCVCVRAWVRACVFCYFAGSVLIRVQRYKESKFPGFSFLSLKQKIGKKKCERPWNTYHMTWMKGGHGWGGGGWGGRGELYQYDLGMRLSICH